MAFPSEILEIGVGLASQLLDGVNGTVEHVPWTGEDNRGEEDPRGTPVLLRAIIDTTRKQITTSAGKVVSIVATLTFLDPIVPNGAAGRREPIDPRDRLTLPDGTTGPIIDVPGSVMNPNTGLGFINQVMLGAI